LQVFSNLRFPSEPDKDGRFRHAFKTRQRRTRDGMSEDVDYSYDVKLAPHVRRVQKLYRWLRMVGSSCLVVADLFCVSGMFRARFA
jgi:hypothetical protein